MHRRAGVLKKPVIQLDNGSCAGLRKEIDGKDCVAVEHVVQTQPLKPTNNPPLIISAEKETTADTRVRLLTLM